MTAFPRLLALPEFPWNLFTPAKELANLHPDGICDLSIGTPVDPTPQFIRDALAEASDAHGYPSVIGARQLREVILVWGAHRCMTDVGVEGVIPTIGSKEAVAWFPTLLGVRPGDTVFVPEVAYPAYGIGMHLAGATPVLADPIQPDTWPDAAFVSLDSPGNPDGHVLSIPQLWAAFIWAREHEAVIVPDECYAAFPWATPWIYEGAPSILDEVVCEGDPNGVIVPYPLSKQSSLAGYRAAVIYGDPVLIVRVVELRKHSGFMVPAPVQHAMTLALADNEHVEAQRRVYEAGRDVLLEAVESLGPAKDPNSAVGLYLWVAKLGNSGSWALVNACAELDILVAPGDFYGEAAKGRVRIALTASDERIRAACECLRAVGPFLG